MSMFRYALAGQSEANQRFAELELARFQSWVLSRPVAKREMLGEPVFGALEMVERAISACSPLTCEQYYAVCGAAAVLAYITREADEGFHWLNRFFRGVPDVFQIAWQNPQTVEGVPDGQVILGSEVGYGWE